MMCRDVELAKFQSFLEREKASNIVSNIRTVQQLAYPIAGYAHVSTSSYGWPAQTQQHWACKSWMKMPGWWMEGP